MKGHIKSSNSINFSNKLNLHYEKKDYDSFVVSPAVKYKEASHEEELE